MYCWYLLAIDPVMYDIHVYIYIYTLWLFNSLPWYRWPIYRWFTWVYLLKILKMVIFHGYVK